MSFSMQDSNTAASRAIGLIHEGNLEQVHVVLDPFALARTKFPILDRIGARLGQSSLENRALLKALDEMIPRSSIGYYVIAGSALQQRLGQDMMRCLASAASYIIIGDRWDRCDTMAERVWGEALIENFDQAYRYFAKMVSHENRWIRRAVGVAVHHYVKKKHNTEAEMRRLLRLLAPVVGEHNRDVVKGIGWGLKTIGKYQPELLVKYLRVQTRRAHLTKLMLRKAATYLPASAKREFLGR